MAYLLTSDSYVISDEYVIPMIKQTLSIVTPSDIPIRRDLNMNYNPEIHKMFRNEFYYKTLDDWLWDDMINILGYLKIVNGQVSLINKLDDYKREIKDSQSDIEKKIDYIENVILSKKNMYRLLFKFTSENNINWVDLPKHIYLIKSLIKKYLKKKITKMIEKKH